MKHDELLGAVDKMIILATKIPYSYSPPLNALRAVVELHMPDIPWGLHEAIEACPLDGDVYPCSTIQAIEKELQ